MWRGQMGILPGSTSAPTLYPLGDSMESSASGVLDAAGDGPLVVVGCSMGGSCALEMARQAGDRIAALVLAGTNAGHLPEPEVRDGYVAALREGGAARVWPGLVDHLFSDAATRTVIEAAEAIAMEQNAADLILATQVFHSRPDATDVVSNWQKPLVVIGGDQDGIVSVEKSTGIATIAPNGRLHVMQGCGHFANLERPAQFNDLISKVLHSISRGRV